jgi:hypothetical protein
MAQISRIALVDVADFSITGGNSVDYWNVSDLEFAFGLG